MAVTVVYWNLNHRDKCHKVSKQPQQCENTQVGTVNNTEVTEHKRQSQRINFPSLNHQLPQSDPISY